jgi:EmrB/QacA subfamily drug resistance transporter
VAIPLAIKLLDRDEPEPGTPLDWWGLALLSPGLAAFVYGLAKMAQQGGFNSSDSIVPTIVGGVLILGFVFRALKARDPLLDVRLFSRRPVFAGATTMALFALAFFGAMLLLPLYFQLVRGESAFMSGLLLAPQGLGAMLMMPIGGILTDKMGPGKLVLAGIPLMLLSFIPLTQVTADTSYWIIGTAFFFMGIGMGATMMPAMSAALQNLAHNEVPRATTSLNIIQQVAGAMGTAILAVLLANELADRLPAVKGGAGGGLGAAQVPDAVREHIAPLMAGAFATTFWWATGLLALAILPALLLPRTPASHHPHVGPDGHAGELVITDGDDDGDVPRPPLVSH